MDFAIIAVDLFVVSFDSMLGDVSFLRLIRLLRLARIFILFQLFPELRLLVAGLAGACKSIVWGAALLGLILIMWSILAVQVIHPLNVEIAQSGAYHNCERCPRAFETCFRSLLTLIQQVVAGDAWGQVSLPIMEAYPLSAIFFLGVLLSVGLAIMNLILAVVVNVAISERDRLQEDIKERSWEKSSSDEQALLDACKTLEEGEGRQWDGTVSLEKMVQSCRSNEEFSDNLESYGVSEDDLCVMNEILDPNKTGKIQFQKFVDGVYRLKNFDQVYMLTSMRRTVGEMKHEMKRMKQEMKKAAFSTNEVEDDRCPDDAEKRRAQTKAKIAEAARKQEWLRLVSRAGDCETQDRTGQDLEETSTITGNSSEPGSTSFTTKTSECSAYVRMNGKQASQKATHVSDRGLDVEGMLSQHLAAMQHMHERYMKVIETVGLSLSPTLAPLDVDGSAAECKQAAPWETASPSQTGERMAGVQGGQYWRHNVADMELPSNKACLREDAACNDVSSLFRREL